MHEVLGVRFSVVGGCESQNTPLVTSHEIFNSNLQILEIALALLQKMYFVNVYTLGFKYDVV